MSTTTQPPDITAHLDAAERAATPLLDALRTALNAIPDEPYLSGVRASLAERIAHAARAGDNTRERALLAEIARPKGPRVALEHVGDRGTEDRGVTVEIIRRTATQVFCRSSHGGEQVYRVADGEPVGVVRSHATRIRGFRSVNSRSRIRRSDLAIVLALPVGRNDVSRALDALYPRTAKEPRS